MSKTILAIGAITSAMVLACMAAVLTAVPGESGLAVSWAALKKVQTSLACRPRRSGHLVYRNSNSLLAFTAGSSSLWRAETTPTLAGPAATKLSSGAYSPRLTEGKFCEQRVGK